MKPQKAFKWLVTGGAGFIGSHIVECLLELGQNVRVLDNLSTGRLSHFDSFQTDSESFEFVEGDIRDAELVLKLGEDVDFILHQAAIASVPLSLENPILVDEVNSGGFLNILESARKNRVSKLVFASSSAVYGDSPQERCRETDLLLPKSPYAATKVANENYAAAYFESYGMRSVGLRYFNVFGERQSLSGPYASVIPKWIQLVLSGRPLTVFGDGSAERDFIYVKDVARVNIELALAEQPASSAQVFNLASGTSISVLSLQDEIFKIIKSLSKQNALSQVNFEAERPGDIRVSKSDVSKLSSLLAPSIFGWEASLRKTVLFYLSELQKENLSKDEFMENNSH